MAFSSRPFRFFRAGGFDQVRFENGQDFLNLDQLDWKLWVALACPTKGLSFDQRTLELIDTDHDERIRAPELIAAVKWAGALVNDPDDFLKERAELPLSSINVGSEEGKRIHQAAQTVLTGLGKSGATSISVADSAAALKAFHEMAFNGDGVLPAESTKTADEKQVVLDVMATVGSTDDKSGKKGVTGEQVKQFFAEVQAYVSWLERGETNIPLQTEISAAFEAMKPVRSKIEDYFARCRLVAFDSRAAGALNREEKEYLALAAKDLTITSEEVRAFPLARIHAGQALPLREAVNPAWASALALFADKAVKPLLGERTHLSELEWTDLQSKLAGFEAWQASKAGLVVESLGPTRLRALAKPGMSQLLDVLFAEEKAQEITAQAIASVEKLVRFARDLFRLVNNFVSFKDFYSRQRPGIFQVGTLYLDQRACELSIRVDDAAKHATLAPLSRGFLAYCDCTRKSTSEKMSIAAAFTAGAADNLMVGRNGLFVDFDGKDWDATITRLVENPISVGEAFVSPYKKLARFLETQLAKRASDADTKSFSGMTESLVAVDPTKPPPAAPLPKKFDVGVVAALGVAVGGLTAALGALLQAFFGLGMWMPVGILGVLALISGPAMLIAWLKLRQRNLGPLLDANGWAINAAARINVPFGRSLTKVAKLPPGATLDRTDAFAEGHGWRNLFIVIFLVAALALAWYLGGIDWLRAQIAAMSK